MPQTTIQKLATIRFGSCQFLVGATAGTLVDVGVLRDAVWDYKFDKVEVPTDNGGIISRGVRNEKVTFKANLIELNVDRLAAFYAGVLTKTAVPGAGTPVTDEVVVLTGTADTELAHANGDGTEVTTIVVTNAAGTVTYVRDCDYIVSVEDSGSTAIARAFPAAVATALADVTITTPGLTWTTAGGTFPGLAIGDHITVTGCVAGGGANNGVKTIAAITGTNAFTIVEACTAETPASCTIKRGGIVSGASTLTDYSYTPNTGVTLKGGGLQTFTAQVARFVNTNAAGDTLTCTIYSTTPTGGITINFPSDDDVDPWLTPIEIEGICDETRTAGDQLFIITDEQAP
jgi:hypothetical protein